MADTPGVKMLWCVMISTFHVLSLLFDSKDEYSRLCQMYELYLKFVIFRLILKTSDTELNRVQKSNPPTQVGVKRVNWCHCSVPHTQWHMLSNPSWPRRFTEEWHIPSGPRWHHIHWRVAQTHCSKLASERFIEQLHISIATYLGIQVDGKMVWDIVAERTGGHSALA